MTAIQIRSTIDEMLDGIDDPLVLETYLEILQSTLKLRSRKEIIGSTIEGKAITAESVEKEVLAARNRVKSGRYLRHEDFENEITCS